MVFSTEDLVLIKVLHHEKGYDNWWINHTASLLITVNVHEYVLSRKLVFWTSNWKDVIKYDLYVKFPRIFAHNVKICAEFCRKNFNVVCHVFRLLHQFVLRGPFFSWTCCRFAHLTCNPKSHFFQQYIIRTYFWLFTLSQNKMNCSHCHSTVQLNHTVNLLSLGQYY